MYNPYNLICSEGLVLFLPSKAQTLTPIVAEEICAGNLDSGPGSLDCHHPMHDQQTLPPGVRSHPLCTPDGRSHSGSGCSGQLWKGTGRVSDE